MTKEELVATVKKNPISFGCGALTLAFIAGLYFRSGEIPAAEAELGERTAEAQRYALNIKNSTQLKEQLDSLVRDNKTIESRMVRITALPINRQYFEVLRREAGVTIIEFRQSTMQANVPKGAKTAFIPVAFTVSVGGTLPQVLDFLRAVENGAHYGRVLTATCGVGSNRSGPVTLTLNLELLGLP